MKLVLISAPANICPACVQLKVFLKRLIRKGELKAELEVIDVTKQKEATDLIYKRGLWAFDPEDPKTPHIFVPQLFMKRDGKLYFVLGKPVLILEEVKDVLKKRLEEVSKAKPEELEELSRKYMKEDFCDDSLETIIWGENVPLVVLRPDLCRDVIEKLPEEHKKKAKIVEKLMEERK